MKYNYILRYIWNDLWYASNRSFTLINLIVVILSTGVLILLAGSFFAFRRNGEQVMARLGLNMEITSSEETVIEEPVKKRIQLLPGIASLHWWTPTVFLFYNKEGRLYDGIGGRALDLDDPILNSLRDIRSQMPIRFQSKRKSSFLIYDEIALIVPFIMLKQLDYLPPSASVDKPQTWSNVEFPTKLKIMVKEKSSSSLPVDVELPVIGVVEETEGGRYLITKDCYKIFGISWKNEFRPFLFDRYNRPIFRDFSREEQRQNPLMLELPAIPDTHATIYAINRAYVLPLIQNIRNLGLKVNCALEHYIEDYQKQQNFFLGIAGVICLVMLFFSGTVLFTTFHTLALRKFKEIGILKACGASRFLVYQIFVMESALISTMAITIGIILGGYSGIRLEKFIQQQLLLPDTEWFSLSPLWIVSLFFLNMIFCLAVTFFPVRTAVAVDPDLVVRS